MYRRAFWDLPEKTPDSRGYLGLQEKIFCAATSLVACTIGCSHSPPCSRLLQRWVSPAAGGAWEVSAPSGSHAPYFCCRSRRVRPRPVLPGPAWPFKTDPARLVVGDARGEGAVTWAGGGATLGSGSSGPRPLATPVPAPYRQPQPRELPSGPPSSGTPSQGPHHLPIPGPRGAFPS